MRVYPCAKQDCGCDEPVVIRRIDGRNVALHLYEYVCPGLRQDCVPNI